MLLFPDGSEGGSPEAGSERSSLASGAPAQTPAAWGGHEFGDWPIDQIAGGFGGDLHAATATTTPASPPRRQRTWETPEGDKRSVPEIEADKVGASLKWATAKVERAPSRGNGERSRPPV